MESGHAHIRESATPSRMRRHPGSRPRWTRAGSGSAVHASRRALRYRLSLALLRRPSIRRPLRPDTRSTAALDACGGGRLFQIRSLRRLAGETFPDMHCVGSPASSRAANSFACPLPAQCASREASFSGARVPFPDHLPRARSWHGTAVGRPAGRSRPPSPGPDTRVHCAPRAMAFLSPWIGTAQSGRAVPTPFRHQPRDQICTVPGPSIFTASRPLPTK